MQITYTDEKEKQNRMIHRVIVFRVLCARDYPVNVANTRRKGKGAIFLRCAKIAAGRNAFALIVSAFLKLNRSTHRFSENIGNTRKTIFYA